ncbi:MAG: NADH:flavin oxidoreductase [Ilumatobacteraceae bacterium]
MSSLLDPVSFSHGPSMPNRFMLAPLTNQQSHADGTLSDEERTWLVMRAEGGFGLVMTCAAHVQRRWQGFCGQLGTFGDEHVAGLSGLASAIKSHGSVAICQLHHAGRRAPAELIGEQPVCPSDDSSTGARALTTGEVDELVADFVAAAVRCDRAGFDGVELHGAHDYLICQFLSAETNRRTDEWGGSLENRSRLLMTIIEGIRASCRSDFSVSVRLSPERFGMVTSEICEVFDRLVDVGVDFIDMSLWDVFKEPADENLAGRRLVDVFADRRRAATRLAVAGKLYSAADAQRAVDAGADIAVIGRGAIVHHDFARLAADPTFAMRELPVPAADLRAEGLSDLFVGNKRNWKGFVAD